MQVKYMKLRDRILITTILISTVIVLGLSAISGYRFQTLLTNRMVKDY